jgi:hypothetical protein
MGYKIGEWAVLRRDFQRCFGLPIGDFCDGMMTVACGRLVIDIVKFDNYMTGRHGDYTAEGKSIGDIVREKYGDVGLTLLDELL